jgi:hypothetical protein
LKLTLQAHTWAELMEDTSDVLNSVFVDLLNSKELNTFLQSHGWTMVSQIPEHVEDVRFDVPFFFVPEMANSHGSQKRVSQ